MDQENNSPRENKLPPENNPRKTKTSTRVLAFLGVIFMVLLVLGYTYSVATGKIFAW